MHIDRTFKFIQFSTIKKKVFKILIIEKLEDSLLFFVIFKFMY